jgi:hypothetical protein
VLCIEGLRYVVDDSRTLCLTGDAACSVVRKVAQKAVGLGHRHGGAVATDTGQFSRWDCVSVVQRV